MNRPSLRAALTGGLVAAAALTVTGAAVAGEDVPPPAYVSVQEPAPSDRDCPRDADRGSAPAEPAPATGTAL